MHILGSPLDRPTPRALSFAQTHGAIPKAVGKSVLVEGEGQALPHDGPLDQVAIMHADAQIITQGEAPAVEQAAQDLKPGGTLLLTTGRSLMGDLEGFREQMDGYGFHNLGVIFQEKAYVVAEKDVLPGLGQVSPEQSKLLLARAQFAGNPNIHGEVDAAGLAPQFTTSAEGKRVHLSRPFKSRGYQAVLGYVEQKDGSLQSRLFYQSKSQGMWRSASGLIGQILGKGPDGHFESSTTLPASMQKTMQTLTAAVPPVAGEHEAIFHAPLEKLDGQHPGRFDQEVEGVPFGAFASDRPDSFRYDSPGQAPDFSNGVKDSFKLDHPMRGSLDAYIVDSKDDSARYLFLRDGEQRTWLGSVEARTEANSFLVPEKALMSGALTHPAIEYTQQVAPEYRGPAVVKEQVYNNFTKTYEEVTTYVDATAFVNQLPPVRDFQAWLASAPPQIKAG